MKSEDLEKAILRLFLLQKIRTKVGNEVSGVMLYLVGFLLLFFTFVLVRYECMLQFMCTRLVFIMFVAHVCACLYLTCLSFV